METVLILIYFFGLYTEEFYSSFDAAVSSTPRHFCRKNGIIPVGYYCPSASLSAENLFSTFIDENIDVKFYSKDISKRSVAK